MIASLDTKIAELLNPAKPGGDEGAKFYDARSLSQILRISEDRLRAWVKAGLVQPAEKKRGVLHFNFRQVVVAKSLCDLLASGVTLGRVRRSLEDMRAWMPEMDAPLQQLAVIEKSGPLLVRLERGELAEPDGQYHFDFTEEHAFDSSQMKIIPGPRTGADWFAQGLEQEGHGYLIEAAGSYRQALLISGPDADVCFNLANVLRSLGEPQQAMERYLQVVEIDPRFSDAWCNLGICLAELAKAEEACSAFRRAVNADPDNYRAHFNLADCLDELGRRADAKRYWRAFLQFESDGPHADYARSKLQ